MTVEEVFNKLANHMQLGILFHNEMIKIYQFLGLYGYAKCQEYHYYEETVQYQSLQHYYSSNYFKLLQLMQITIPEVIANTWYKYSSQAVDLNTKRTTIKNLMNQWVNWEEETQQLYSTLYSELIAINETVAAEEVKKYLIAVTKELSDIKQTVLELSAIDYDLTLIIDWQAKLKKKYKHKIKTLIGR